MATRTVPAAPEPQAPEAGQPETPVMVRQLCWEAAGVVSVLLARPDGGDLPAWQPGAHVELLLPTGLVRQYSLCGSPGDLSGYRVAVRREPASRGGSEYVHSFLRPGQPLRIRGPRNHFRFEPADSYLFIAGGIGITPILPMVRQAVASGARWSLVYGGRSAASMAFRKELAPHRDAVHLYAGDESGRIPLAALLGRTHPDTAVYACGPEPLLDAVTDGAGHLPQGTVRMERFRPRTREHAHNTEVEVVCARSGRTVGVPAERSVLDALADAGLPVAGSCREGVCGTCETRVLEGVPDHRDDILSGEEREKGDRMYLCVSRARTPRLVLDV
ncbi:PDR/VanB family oxidoreductase [Streptomyces sp. DSM 41527]|uniref:PDR/VanB family oxidoreductase n=1 Tax=Streptomyces mooreae TaxID=3075523 RepID=A0ABU2T8R1_9ACTN|nr:PDR/VanB family oxidoreductase [Streptomyces sp. DSM 41527]MDT0457314.1 PDR/VanB family oxidoreductase [Streptomyces sp. DSM 41527]